MKLKKEVEAENMAKKTRWLILTFLGGGLILLFLTIFTGGIGGWLRRMGINYELGLAVELVFSIGLILLGLFFSLVFKLDMGIWPHQKLNDT